MNHSDARQLAKTLNPALGLRVCIDPGHGGRDTGAVGNGLEEKGIALPVALGMRWPLILAGAEMHTTRVGDVHKTTTTRAVEANEFNAHCFVSVHVNQSGNPAAHGRECWAYCHSRHGIELAGHLLDAMGAAMPGQQSRGIKLSGRDAPWSVKHPTVLTATKMPAVIIELGFLTNPDEARALDDPQVQTALSRALARGVVEWWRVRS